MRKYYGPKGPVMDKKYRWTCDGYEITLVSNFSLKQYLKKQTNFLRPYKLDLFFKATTYAQTFVSDHVN